MSEEEEFRLSLRVSGELMVLVEMHQERMEKLTGAPFTKTQAVASLIEAGSIAWGASVRVGALSPAVVVTMGADAIAKGGK